VSVVGRVGTPKERLERKLVRQPNGCLVWTGALYEFGHGCIAFNGKNVGTHRLAWELANDRPVPVGLCILHSCDNPPCCEPTHLRPGTKLENNEDCVERGRWSSGPPKTHCPQRHEYTEANTYVNPKTGQRQCRACHRAQALAAYHRERSAG